MSRPCQIWSAQSDRLALGERLSASELAFQHEHAASCTACRAEGRLWDALEGSLESSGLLTSPLDCRATKRPSLRARLRRRLAQLPGARFALLAALVGSVLGVVWLFVPSRTPARSQAVAPNPVQARIAFVSGEARVNRQHAAAGHPLGPGDVLEVTSGHLCLLVPPSVTVCADQHTRLSVEKLVASERRLKLHAGYVVARLAPQPPGTSFGFETDAGALVAKGTIFAVEAAEPGDVRLRVHEGTVVNERAPNTQAFVAPAAARVGKTAEREALSSELVARDAPLIELARFWPDEASCTLDVRATPHGGRVTLDGTLLGHTPMTALVRAGSYRLTLEHGGFAPVAERLALRAAERVVRHYELVQLPASQGASATAPTETAARPGAALASGPTAAALLARARELRAAGRFGEAQSTYSRLVQQHPRSAEAKAALVSLGELELTQLGNAGAALKSFDAYLRSGGGLVQEASYGRIRALRKLGRHSEERAAIARFIADYPRSVQAASLRARLSEP